MATTVADIMERNVHTIHCQKTVAETEDFLVEHGVSGAPMVSTEGQLLGVVSKTDIARFHRDARHGDAEAQMVYEIGSPETVTVDETRTVREAAQLMVSSRVHRLVVVSGGRPVGILSSLDVARMVAEGRR